MSYEQTRSPGAASGGSGVTQWTNPSSAGASDNAYATTNGYYVGYNLSEPLLLSDFGFDIPYGSVILGVKVSVERRSSADTLGYSFTRDNNLRLIKNGTVGGTNKAIYTLWPITDVVADYGTPSDLWGQSWSYADINSANFGVYLITDSYSTVESGQTVTRVDHIQVTIYYDDIAPTPPTGLTRTNFDATDDAAFSWTFSDPNTGDTQSAYQLLIYDVSDSSLDYDSGKITSTSSSMTLTADTLTNGKQYQWKLRVWDDDDNVSDYSFLATFYTSAKPTVSITSPAADHDDLASATISVTWSSTDQTSYRAKLFTSTDQQIEDSGKLTNANTAHTFSTPAVNDGAYYITVDIFDDKDVQSVTATRYFEAAFIAPPTPTIVVTTDNTRGSVTIVITNPAPSGGQPAFSYNTVYRKPHADTAYTRIATGIAEDASFTDYTPASGVQYDYKVRSVGDTTGYADSAVSAQTITLSVPQVANMADNSYVALAATSRAAPKKLERVKHQFAGREKPVYIFGEHEDMSVDITALAETDAEFAALMAILNSKQTLLYRDERGRKVFGTVDGYSASDVKPTGYTVRFGIDEEDYTEAV
jgi:hypothetical protein